MNKKRVLFFMSVIILMFILTSARLIHISSSVDKSKYVNNTSSQEIRSRPDILDRNGLVIATNLATMSLYANASKIKEPEKIVSQLAELFPDLEEKRLLSSLKSKKNFVWVRRYLSPKEQLFVHNLGIPGLYFIKDQRRTYTQGSLFSHVVGYVGKDQNGLAGIEFYIDANSKYDEPLQLSLDTKVQSVLRKEIIRAVDKYRAKGGAGVILDVNNGEVLALVSIPDFNPHVPSKADDKSKFNRATLGVYEMGSTLKIFTIAAALDSGAISITDTFNVSQEIKVSGYKIKDMYKTKEPITTVENIFSKSSNIGMAKIAMNLGGIMQKEYFSKFGFLSSLSIEVPEKSNPVLPKQWESDITIVTLSYGYSIALTLLHVAQAAAAVINGGCLHSTTYLLKKDTSNLCSTVVTRETSGQMRHLMETVVKKGTGRLAEVKGYNVGGKTGTAEKSMSGSYAEKSNLLSFIAAFPINSPRYVVAIMLDEPNEPDGDSMNRNKRIMASLVVAPVISNVIKRIGPMLNIEPDNI